MRKQQRFDPQTGQIIDDSLDEKLKAESDPLYKHYKPDVRPNIYSLASHFEKSEMRASKVSGVETNSLITETSPD